MRPLTRDKFCVFSIPGHCPHAVSLRQPLKHKTGLGRMEDEEASWQRASHLV
jgi:hypothetical protein